MGYTPEEVLQYIEEEDVRFIRLAFRDAYGTQKNVAVLPGEVRKAFEYGTPVLARDIPGFSESGCATLYLRPDPDTLTVLPWRSDSGEVVRMFCDVCTPEGEVYPSDTRGILRKAVQKAAEAGIEFRFGTESEFYLFRKDEEGNPTRIPYDQAGYLDIAPEDRCENVRREISQTIERMGLTPERSFHERGPGQNEIAFHYATPLKAADQFTTFKMVVRTTADRYGLTADFSPMPLPGCPGNGFHINLYARNREGEELGLQAAAGILEKIRDITLFLNPTDSSYARFGNSTAPDRVNWSSEGRDELMHIDTFRGRIRTELRSPDASCNPYLVYTFLIYAGLLGIERGLTPEEGGDAGGMPLPSSRQEAARIAWNSSFVRGILPDELLKVYCG